MVIKDIKEIDDIANQVFGRTLHAFSLELTEYNHLKDTSSSVVVIKIDIPKLTNDAIASIEGELNEFETSRAGDGILYVCENDIITAEQMDMIFTIMDKYFDDTNFSLGLSGVSNHVAGAEIYIFLGCSR